MCNQQGLEKVLKEIKKHNVTVSNRTTWKTLLAFCFIIDL